MAVRGQVGRYGLLVAGLVLVLGNMAVAQSSPFFIEFEGEYGPVDPWGTTVYIPSEGDPPSLSTPWYLAVDDVPCGIADPGQSNGVWKQIYADLNEEDPPNSYYFLHHQSIPGVCMPGAGMLAHNSTWSEAEVTGPYGGITAYKDTFVILPDDNTFENGDEVKVRVPFRWRIPITNPPTNRADEWSLLDDTVCYNVSATAAIHATIVAVSPDDSDSYGVDIEDTYAIDPEPHYSHWWEASTYWDSGNEYLEYDPDQVFSAGDVWVDGYLNINVKIGDAFDVTVPNFAAVTNASTVIYPPYVHAVLAGSAFVVQFFEPYAYALADNTPISENAPLTTYARSCSNVQSHRLAGDANLDGSVDVVDLLIVTYAFGSYFLPVFTGEAIGDDMFNLADIYDVRADLNLDGAVDVVDLLILTADWGLSMDLPPQLTDEEWDDILE